LFASDFLALTAALLSTLDGLHLVMSRVALLDIFLTALLLAGVLAFLYKRHLVAAIFLGLALSTKWNALFVILAILIYLLIKERKVILNYLLAIPFVYLTSWVGWFQSDQGYDRSTSANPILALFEYHRSILSFHTNLDTDHPYQASPWSWLYLGRPTSFFYESPKCGASECSREILALGTPIIWWVGIIALLITFKYLKSRDWVAGFIIVGFAANYLPWLLIPDRTTFYFYAITLQPFLILSICYTIYVFLKTESGQKYGELAVQSGIALTTLVFIYFLPIYLGTTLSYDAWSARMWFASWI
jgi:dolichyl-phosphate-mannose--protein O-mannosyl transferase